MNRRMTILIIFSLALHLAVLGALTVSMKTQDFELGSSSRTEILALESGSINSPTSHKQVSPPSRDLRESHETADAGVARTENAKGSGGSPTSNTQTIGSPGPVTIGSTDPYYSQVRARIQSHATYTPALARRRLQGQVQVALTLLSNGGIASLEIAKSSGSPDLDHQALESVQAAAPFPAFQSEISARKLELPIDFRLH